MNFTKYRNKKYPGFLELESHFPYLIKQLEVDNEISNALKIEFLDKISTSKFSSKEELVKVCNSFFESKMLIGTICKKSNSNNCYIRVNSKESLISWISQIVGIPVIKINKLISTILYSPNEIIKMGLMNKLMNIEATNDSYFIKDNCLKYFGKEKWSSKFKPTLKQAFLLNYNYIQWSFPDEKSEDLFKNQATIDLLPCRAGLISQEEKILFTHNLNDTYNVRKPTVFDARLYPQFQPGGSTNPLNSCKHLSGFKEFVHIPNNFKNIVSFKGETFYKI